MAYCFVCDGGGSKTESILFDEHGRILASAKGSGANALFLPAEQAVANVSNQLEATLKKAGIQKEQLKLVRLFIPGFKKCASEVQKILPETVEFEVEGDEQSAFYGALGQPEGIAVLSGTGSFSVGRTLKGKLTTVGGWGPVMGDQGSGYQIGLRCLQELARLTDAGQKGSVLEKAVLKALESESVLELRSRTSQPDFDRAHIAALCPIVGEAAQQGDETAGHILDEAAAELAELARLVAQKLGSEQIPVVLIGGVSKMGPVFTERFRQKLSRCLPKAEYRPPMYSPVIGAMLCVLDQELGVDICSAEIIENIRKTGENLC